MEWSEARRLLETAVVRGKPAKLVVDADVMVAARRHMQERYTSFHDLAPPLDTLFYRGVPLEFSPAVQGVVPVWKEEVVKVGDYVTVKDGSWSMELVNWEWKHDFPSDTRRQDEVWRVMATGLKLPTYIPTWLTMGVSDNDVLLARVGDEGHLLATRAEFLVAANTGGPTEGGAERLAREWEEIFDKFQSRHRECLSRCLFDLKEWAEAPIHQRHRTWRDAVEKHLENKLESFSSDLDETDNDVETLQRKVRVLEQQVKALADRPLPCCAKRVDELEKRMKSMEAKHVWIPFA